MSTHKRSANQMRQQGFFLIEAMVSFVIMSVGLLALAGMQISLSRNADVAKQRVEAMRLAQQRIETMRSFTDIAATTTTPVDPDRTGTPVPRLAWSDIATASDVHNPLQSAGFSNASFQRSWTVGGAVTDPMRPISVSVSWTDRANGAQTVTLNSVISQSNPANAGSLGFPLPNNTNLKLPKNRTLNIPVPATDLGGGKSAYQVNANLAIIFSNLSGNVVQKCSTTVTAGNYNGLSGSSQCSDYSAYIVAGYISGDITNASNMPTRPTGINSSGISYYTAGGKTISCSYDIAKDQSTNALITSSHYYLCVVPVATTNGTWSGTLRIGGVPVLNDFKVCRFQYPGTTGDSTDLKNSRNVQPYVNVNTSLDNQNYYVESSSDSSCPAIGGLQTILHQDCRLTNAARVTECPATAANTPAT